MATKTKKENNKVSTKDNLYLVINLVLAIVTMGFCAALTSRVMLETADLKQISIVHGFTILTQVLFCILLFVVKDKAKDKFRALVVGLIYIAAMIMAFMAFKHFIIFIIAEALVVVAMAINQFLQVSKDETKKGIITNILVGITLILLAIGTLVYASQTTSLEDNSHYGPMVTVVLFLFISFKKVLFPTLKLEKMKLLLNILVKTHTIDVIVCLLAVMILFSFVLPRAESASGTIKNFWDAMWYCFTVITTIGFGDFYAVSLVGRILTVILGIYGIVVVAIITSVVVNFYNEVTSKEKARDFIE